MASPLRKRFRQSKGRGGFCFDNTETEPDNSSWDSQVSVLYADSANNMEHCGGDAETHVVGHDGVGDSRELQLSQGEPFRPVILQDDVVEICDSVILQDDVVEISNNTSLGMSNAEEDNQDYSEWHEAILIQEMQKKHPNVIWLTSCRQHAIARVRELADAELKEVCKIKIGITSSPCFRFSGRGRQSGCCVVPHCRHHAMMNVLFCGTDGDCRKLERELIAMIADHTKCDNELPGGEGPLSSVMFVYVVYSDLDTFMKLHNKYMKALHQKRVASGWYS